jgi:NADH-ubiquinone oxidoreductase chain 5
MMIGLGTDFWGNSLYVLPQNLALLESEYIPQSRKLLPLGATLIGGFLAYLFNFPLFFAEKGYRIKTRLVGRKLYTLFNKRWFFDKVYNDFIGQKALDFGYITSWKKLDKGCFEVIGPYGVGQTFPIWSRHISRLQSGVIYHYAVIMLLGLTLAITLVALWDMLEVFIDPRFYFLFLITFLFCGVPAESNHSFPLGSSPDR